MTHPLILFLSLSSFVLAGQADFRKHYDTLNPAPTSSGLPLEERFRIHRQFVAEAEKNEDTLRWLLGELYLFYDNLYLSDYSAARTHLLNSENLAVAAENVGWQGWVAYRRGTLYMRLREKEKAITAYKEAVEKCGIAGDSLCVAENLEQISAVYALQDSFSLARKYFNLAYPMLQRHGEKKQLATALANFGSFLNQQDLYSEAIPYLKEAMDLQEEMGNLVGWGKAKNNLALSYLRTGEVKKALKMFKECLRFNLEHGFQENALRNYAGIRESYLALDDYRAAYNYQSKYIGLRDSLLGEETKLEIAELEAKYNTSRQELALRESELQLEVSQRRSQLWGGTALFLFVAGVASSWYWRRKNREKEHRVLENRKNLTVITRLLAEKNAALLRLRAENEANTAQNLARVALEEESREGSDEYEIGNLYAQTILTPADWMDFKAHFENAHPGYQHRLRMDHPSLTEAEERLFLLLKLGLSSKEIATILGISIAGVKKTRNRLRKRLEFDLETDLEQFVQNF